MAEQVKPVKYITFNNDGTLTWDGGAFSDLDHLFGFMIRVVFQDTNHPRYVEIRNEILGRVRAQADAAVAAALAEPTTEVAPMLALVEEVTEEEVTEEEATEEEATEEEATEEEATEEEATEEEAGSTSVNAEDIAAEIARLQGLLSSK